MAEINKACDEARGRHPMTFTAKELAASVAREITYRKRVYARLIEAGKMTREKADREIAMFEQIRADYEARAAEEERQGRLI